MKICIYRQEIQCIPKKVPAERIDTTRDVCEVVIPKPPGKSEDGGTG